MPDPHPEPFDALLAAARDRPRVTLPWEPARLAAVRAKAGTAGLAPFESRCAGGILAAAEGRAAEAETILLSVLRDFPQLYPGNHHFFTSIVQLAAAAQALELLARFLDDRHAAPGLFVVPYRQSPLSPAINTVAVDSDGHCHFALDPRIPGAEQADYFIGHWLDSAPLWASYCRSCEREAGAVTMNSDDNAGAPGLAYCGNEALHFLVPDNYFLRSRGYAELRAQYAVAPPWDARQAIAFWRGATTGVRGGDGGWESLPRIRLCRLAQHHPDALDAGIATVVQVRQESERAAIAAAGLLRGSVTARELLRYKYQVDIDGNSNAWSGFYQRLLTGSPVLKVASPHGFRQWYYGRLRPWVHFVPVDPDLADLVEKIAWLRAHDAAARSIGARGRAFAESLDYEGELRRANRTIGAAIRYFAGKPETVLEFGAGRSGQACLRAGWCETEAGPGAELDAATDAGAGARAASTAGVESRLELPPPVATGACVLRLELSASPAVPASAPQRVVVIVNGAIVAQSAVAARLTLRCMLPRPVIEAAPNLQLTLLLPDAKPAASAARPLDERLSSLRLHRLELIAAGAEAAGR